MHTHKFLGLLHMPFNIKNEGLPVSCGKNKTNLNSYTTSNYDKTNSLHYTQLCHVPPCNEVNFPIFAVISAVKTAYCCS
jgi:hypothetical protein